MASALRTTPFFCRRYATYLCEAPCGTSTNKPSGANPWYGLVKPYQIHAAAPPAISTITSNSVSKYFNSASLIHFLIRSGLSGRVRLSIQVLLQNDDSRHGVHGHFVLRILRFLAAAQFFVADESSLNFFQQTLGFPTRQPLVHHFHRHADLLPQALRKALRFFGHFAPRAI